MKSVLLFFSFFLVSCATSPVVLKPNPQTGNKDSEPVEGFEMDDGRVSLASARSLSRSSYLLGCVEAHVLLGAKKGSHEKCKKLAEEHLKSNVDIYFKEPTDSH